MRSVLAVLAAALCFSTTGTAQAIAGADASPIAVGAARILVGGAVLAAVAFARRPAAHRPVAGGRVPTWVLVAIGAAGVLGYQPCFFLGTRENGVAIGTVVALGSAPVMTGVLEAVVRRRPPSRRWALATAVCVAGVVLVSGVVAGGAQHVVGGGVLASLGAAASYAVYTTASKALLDRGWAPTRAMGAVFGVAAACSLPLLAVAGAGWLATPEGACLALWLGLVTTAAAYLLFGSGLRSLRAATVSTLTLAEPLGATLLGVLLLDERLSAASVAGIVLIVAGLLLLDVRLRGGRARVAPAG